MRGQVGGWLYIACERTSGLGSDETRAGRAGRAGVGLARNGGRTGGERGRIGGGNGVGLEGGTGSD